MAHRLLFRHGSLVRPAAAAACACGLALQRRSEPSNSLFASKPSIDAVEPEKKLAQYEMGAELGQGAFGVVRIATKSGVQYALKIVKKRSKLCDAMAEKEAELLRAVSPHDNIVGLVDAFELPTEYAFVMDLARGGEVFDRICDNGPFSEHAAADVVRQVALALDHANKRGVCHRDIKPENLLLTDGTDQANVKLCDFGCAAFIPKDQPVTGRWGTAGYMAPEVIRGDGYGPAVDSFSLGVLLFILLGGYNPFDPGGDSADPVIEKRVLSNQWAFDPECFGSVSKEAKDLITKLLSTAPEMRPTSSDLLANKWVMGNASAAPLPASDKRLKMFNDLRRSWRAAIGAIELITILPTAADKDQLKLRTFQSTNPDYDPKKQLSPDALAELRVSFDSFDTANSGTISMAELLSKFKALGASEEEARGVMELIDSHHTGDISFDEFASAIGPLMASRKSSALKRAFDRFDSDGSGKIDRNELRSMLVKLGWNADDTKVDEMMRIADQTGDGQISFDEFKTLLDCEAAQKRMDSKTASDREN